MKYIIDVSKDRVSKGGKLELLCEVENSLPQYVHTAIDAVPYKELDRKAIEDEVWELADYMSRMSLTERDLCFGFPLPQEVTMNLSYQEAKAKFEAWLKQKDEICVGDEVEYGFIRGIAFDVDEVIVEGLYIYDEENVGKHFRWNKRDCKKTGRHFDEVAELLKKMRGEQDE